MYGSSEGGYGSGEAGVWGAGLATEWPFISFATIAFGRARAGNDAAHSFRNLRLLWEPISPQVPPRYARREA